jgi:predicted glycosyltransferase
VKIWLDMANSPHPVLFGPLSETLRERGHELWVTSRPHAQTLALSRDRWPDVEVVGYPSPASRIGKTRAIGTRAARLARRAQAERPHVAVSLNSYAQIVAARLARIRSVTIMDYEFQPANHLAFRLADRIVVPHVFPDSALARFGARRERVSRFHGFKEEFYLDHHLGLPVWPGVRQPDTTYVVFRPPPVGALYHRGGNGRFDALLADAARRDAVRALVLPRWDTQRALYASWPGLDVADGPLDGIASLRSSDVFIGAGGTMSREAALLGINAYTMFAGALPAVDAALVAQGRLEDLRELSADGFEWRKEAGSGSLRTESDCATRAAELRGWLADLIERASGREHAAA